MCDGGSDTDMSDGETLADTLPNTVAGTIAGVQNTPQLWKKEFDPEPVEDIASPPRPLPLCTYDEDETQIQFCSNVISQDFGSPGRRNGKSHLELGETSVDDTQEPKGRMDNDEIGDGESSNESEDLWAGGDILLDQRPLESTEEERDLRELINRKASLRTSPIRQDENEENTQVLDENDSMDAPASTENQPKEEVITKSGELEEKSVSLPNQDLSTAEIASTATNDKALIAPFPVVPPAFPPLPVRSDPFLPETKTIDMAMDVNTSGSPSRSKVSRKRGSKRTSAAKSGASNSPPRLSKRLSSYVESLEVDQAPSSRSQKSMQLEDSSDTSSSLNSEATTLRRRASKRQASQSYQNTESIEDSQPRRSKPPLASQRFRSQVSDTADDVIRIVLTGLEPTESILRKIKAIDGAQFEQDVARGTHVIAPSQQLKRTVKMLCGISTCHHILDEKWLSVSAKQGSPASEIEFCLQDSVKEAQWQFSLHKTMYEHSRGQRRELLRGLVFFIVNHKSVLPSAAELSKIIECAGGEVDSKSPRDAQTIVLASPEALATRAVQKVLEAAAPTRLYTPELILTGILRQELDWNANQLLIDDAKPRPRRKK
ncbi:hypothetical protein LEN26_007388 [Aphanomyces euteiches]|nr:hypothetical protein AeMF1_010119 [Aphanomyces euteiches]KAH9132510.1 hypothetical protein LEN26_007388 [Aphanomyces euteiches]KAH9195590.1 hypothetical protein AeNC1_002441 [Aphanomyces euteiches]